MKVRAQGDRVGEEAKELQRMEGAEDLPRIFLVFYFLTSKHCLLSYSLLHDKEATWMAGCISIYVYMCGVCEIFIIVVVLYMDQNLNTIWSSFWEEEPVYQDLGIAKLNWLTHPTILGG